MTRVESTGFDPVNYTHAELIPLVDELLALTDGNGREHAFFAMLQQGLQVAREADDLAEPFVQLSTSAFVGLELPAVAWAVLDQLIAKAEVLSEVLSVTPQERH